MDKMNLVFNKIVYPYNTSILHSWGLLIITQYGTQFDRKAISQDTRQNSKISNREPLPKNNSGGGSEVILS
jgi:hypothetical protein